MFDFTKLGQSAMRDVETVDMGNDFSLAVLKENNEIIEVSIAYKDVCVGVELSLEAAKDYVNSITSEDIVFLNQLVDDFNTHSGQSILGGFMIETKWFHHSPSGSQHTAGGFVTDSPDRRSTDAQTVCHVHHSQEWGRLIAAAPEMLGVLEGLIAVIGDSKGVAGYHLNGGI